LPEIATVSDWPTLVSATLTPSRSRFSSVAERIDLGTHKGLDERGKQRAHEIRVSLTQVLWHQGDEDRSRRCWPSWRLC
jgi:hypothetical protein